MVSQSLDYPDTLPKSFFGNCLRYALSKFESEDALKNGPSRTLWNPIMNGNNERPDKKKQYAGRAQYVLRRKLHMEQVENDGSRVWVARTQAIM